MKKSAIIFTIFLCMAFFAYNALAENGCCLNPNADVCVVTAKDLCCPPEPDNYSDPNGPKNQTDCNATYFAQGEDDACLTLSGANENLCTAGCCCQQIVDTDGNAAVNVQPDKYKLECEGESYKWLTGQCDEARCTDYFTSKKVTEVCDPLAQTNECTQDDDWPLYCIQSVLIGNVINNEYFCCHEFECAAKEFNEEAGENICAHPGESAFTDTFKCYFGDWYDSNKTIEHGELCQDSVSEITSLHFSDIGVCNDENCTVTFVRGLGQCKENNTCKASPYDGNLKVCCKENECGYYDLTTKKCAADQEQMMFTKSDSESTYRCNSGNWELISKELGGEDAECTSDTECKEGYSCLSFTCDRPEFNNYFNKSFCCNATTQSAGETGCVDKGDTITIDSNNFKCVPPSWESVNATPEEEDEPTGGGKCGARGGNPPENSEYSLPGEGQKCEDGKCASDKNLECKMSPADSSDLTAVSPSFCCSVDTECADTVGCVKSGATHTSNLNQKIYTCFKGKWEEAGSVTPAKTKCGEKECYLASTNACIGETTGENYFIDAIYEGESETDETTTDETTSEETSTDETTDEETTSETTEETTSTTPSRAMSDFSNEKDLAKQIIKKKVKGAYLYSCTPGEDAKLVKTCQENYCTGGCSKPNCCRASTDVATSTAAVVGFLIFLGSRFTRKKTAKK